MLDELAAGEASPFWPVFKTDPHVDVYCFTCERHRPVGGDRLCPDGHNRLDT